MKLIFARLPRYSYIVISLQGNKSLYRAIGKSIMLLIEAECNLKFLVRTGTLYAIVKLTLEKRENLC